MKSRPMEWDKERLTELTFKYITGEITVEEQAELNQWLNAGPTNRERFERRISEEGLAKGLATLNAARESMGRARAMIDWELLSGAGERSMSSSGRVYRWRPWIAAATFALLSTGVIALLLRKQEKVASLPPAKFAGVLRPGRTKAVLTLANGFSVVLDSANKGLIARQGHSKVVVTGNGQLVYEKGGSATDTGFNVISTPRGGQWEVKLPDGTKAWLNANSSIKFPTTFASRRREVEMTGEVYFEVEHHADRPFVVRAAGSEIEDIGTHFNVNSYDDEPDVRTTLLEGAVKVGAETLKPGEQIRIQRTGKTELIKNANVEEAVAWKNGLFEFNSADIETVMRAMGRWYDVTVRYETRRDLHRFTGQIIRSAEASEAMKILATSGYHFDIQGRVITVLP